MSETPSPIADENPEPVFHVVPEHYFPALCQVQIRSPTNSFDKAFDLAIDATFNEMPLTVEIAEPGMISSLFGRGPVRQVFRVRLRYCLLTYRLVGCEIPIGSKFLSFAQDGSVKSEHKTRLQTKQAIGAGGSVEAHGGFGLAGANLGVKAQAEVKTDRRDASQTDESSVTRPSIPVVNHVPNGWQFGDTVLGDPRHIHDGSCLKGTYSLHGSEEFAHSCRVEFGSTGIARLSFELTARAGFHVERDGSRSAERATENEEQRVREHMRSLLAGMLVEKQFTTVPSDGSVLLARHAVRVQRSPPEFGHSVPVPVHLEAVVPPPAVRGGGPRRRKAVARVKPDVLGV